VMWCIAQWLFIVAGSPSVWPFNHCNACNIDLTFNLWLVHYCQSSSLSCCLQSMFMTLGHRHW
jgi:hypothetical protein